MSKMKIEVSTCKQCPAFSTHNELVSTYYCKFKDPVQPQHWWDQEKDDLPDWCPLRKGDVHVVLNDDY